MSDVLSKTRALVALAASPSTPPHEAAAAALQACRRIHELDLLGARAESERVSREEKAKTETVAAQVHLYLIQENEYVWRFVRLQPWMRGKGIPHAHLIVIPRDAVVSITWLDPEVGRELYGASERVTDTLLLKKAWADSQGSLSYR